MIKVKKLDNYLDILRGLTFTDDFKIIYFRTRWGIHTFFVKKPIDVAILDNTGRVIKVVTGIKPYRVLLWNPRFNCVLEGPAGFVNKYKIALGVKVGLDYS